MTDDQLEQDDVDQVEQDDVDQVDQADVIDLVARRRLRSIPAASGEDAPVREAAGPALAAFEEHLARCDLAAATVRAYRRAGRTYTDWILAHPEEHPDAFTDTVGAEAAVKGWRRALLADRAAASSVNQALAAVTLLYQLTGLRIHVTRVRLPQPGEPPALETLAQRRLERAAIRRGPRDSAIIFTLLYTGARVEEATRLDLADLAITARTGTLRLFGKGDQVRTVPVPAPAREHLTTWLDIRGREPGPLWIGQRGRLSISGLTQVVLATGDDAGLPGLRPHRLRHTYATRLRQGGADPAQIQALLGHASLASTARYFRAGAAETAAVVERVFGDHAPPAAR